MQAILALEDGRIFRGKGYGAKGECYGEVVFNTSITGYQEIFTDPSYAGQIVVLTNPEIGNYGTNPEDAEATRPYIEGLIVREFSRVSSNWRSQQVAEEYLEQFKIPVLGDIDTRALVRHLRDHGVMRGVISTLETDTEKLSRKRLRFRRWTEPTWPKSSPRTTPTFGKPASARICRKKSSGSKINRNAFTSSPTISESS
jgi:carbamoyl-phosphate synthase small subunit